MTWLLPPILWILCVFSILGITLFAPAKPLMTVPFNLLGLFLVSAGIVLFRKSTSQFKAAKTNINTFKDPGTLMTSGLFAHSRNPVYLAFVIAIIGVAITSNNLMSLGIAALYWAACQFWYIPFEERAALQVFGAPYQAYKKTVRRWI